MVGGEEWGGGVGGGVVGGGGGGEGWLGRGLGGVGRGEVRFRLQAGEGSSWPTDAHSSVLTT